MEQIFLSLSQTDFENLIRNCVRSELQNHAPAPPEPKAEDELLTTEQARDLLKVSKVTLNNWRKTGRLNFYRIGNRIRYRKNEVLAVLQPKKNYEGHRPKRKNP